MDLLSQNSLSAFPDVTWPDVARRRYQICPVAIFNSKTFQLRVDYPNPFVSPFFFLGLFGLMDPSYFLLSSLHHAKRTQPHSYAYAHAGRYKRIQPKDYSRTLSQAVRCTRRRGMRNNFARYLHPKP